MSKKCQLSYQNYLILMLKMHPRWILDMNLERFKQQKIIDYC